MVYDPYSEWMASDRGCWYLHGSESGPELHHRVLRLKRQWKLWQRLGDEPALWVILGEPYYQAKFSLLSLLHCSMTPAVEAGVA